ncbi:hypothetical protein ACIGN6_31930 [Streptomyces sp. NPDC053792]|uniref:hypothetical protein n=1 Tax=Streptomyces sp. NPDC053792 TaxID=3365716 RepID=UPI0037D5A1CE
MSEWGIALIAAGAAVGGSGITGWFTLRAGRRQVSGQAQVEHEQWLRGQRQEAYTRLISAWDQSVRDLDDLFESAPVRVQVARRETAELGDEFDVWSALGAEVESQVDEAYAPVFAALEVTSLLGPERVDRALVNLEEALQAYGAAAREDSDGPGWPNYTAQRSAWPAVKGARAEFMAASRDVIRSAPDPASRRPRR